MTVSDRAIIDENLKNRASDIIRVLAEDRPWDHTEKNWYAITTSPSDRSLLYILSKRELKYNHSHYHKLDLRIVGIASSRRKARHMVEAIFEEARDKGLLHDMKRFLNEY